MRKTIFVPLFLMLAISTASIVFLSGSKAGATNNTDKDAVQVSEPIPVVYTVTGATQQELKEICATITPEPEQEPEPVEIPTLASAYDIELIARTIWGEAEVVKSTEERAAVAWCILNRVDSSGDAIQSIILAPYQFACRENGEIPDWAFALAEDVVDRWERERAGESDVGRTLPADYLFFVGDGRNNHFTVEWKGTDYWDWSLANPYEN